MWAPVSDNITHSCPNCTLGIRPITHFRHLSIKRVGVCQVIRDRTTKSMLKMCFWRMDQVVQSKCSCQICPWTGPQKDESRTRNGLSEIAGRIAFKGWEWNPPTFWCMTADWIWSPTLTPYVSKTSKVWKPVFDILRDLTLWKWHQHWNSSVGWDLTPCTQDMLSGCCYSTCCDLIGRIPFMD